MAGLLVFGGLPGTGKTTVSRLVAGRLRAPWLRVDAIEQAIAGGGDTPAGYAVAHAVARGNLALGHVVVVDGVHPVAANRQAWRALAAALGVASLEVELVCADQMVHRRRVEARVADLAGHRLPTWAEVQAQPHDPRDRTDLVLDTAALGVKDAVAAILAAWTRPAGGGRI